MTLRRRNNRWLTVTGVVVSALLLWLTLREADVAGVLAAFRHVRPWSVVVFSATLLAYYLLKSTRWSTLLSPLGNAPPGRLFAPVMIGYTAGIFLPMQLGELVKAYLAAKRFQLPGAAVLSSIALERVFDIGALLLIVAVAFFAGTQLPESIATAALYIGAIATSAVVLAVIAIVWTDALMRAVGWFAPAALHRSITSHAENAIRGLHSLRDPVSILRIAVNSVLQWTLMGASMYVSLVAVGIDVPLAAAVLVLVFTVISLTLPTSPGNVGSIQVAYYLALKPFGVSASVAFSASVYFHVLSYAVVAVCGLYCLRDSGYRFGELINSARQQPSGDAPTHQAGEDRNHAGPE